MSKHDHLGEPSALYFKNTYVVQEGDIDGLGHMNNTVYLRLMENLAWAHSKHLGLGVEAFQRIGRESFIIQLLSTQNHTNYET